MSHLFCHSCGNKLEFAQMKPNFCIKCGQQLNMSHASATVESEPTIIENVNLGEDETNITSLPTIDKLQVDCEVAGNNTFTLGSLAGKNTPPTYTKGATSKSVNEFIDEKERQ